MSSVGLGRCLVCPGRIFVLTPIDPLDPVGPQIFEPKQRHLPQSHQRMSLKFLPVTDILTIWLAACIWSFAVEWPHLQTVIPQKPGRLRWCWNGYTCCATKSFRDRNKDSTPRVKLWRLTTSSDTQNPRAGSKIDSSHVVIMEKRRGKKENKKRQTM